MIEFKVAGFDELEAALRALGEEVGGRVLADALRTAGEPMADDARSTALRSSKPNANGHMADTIKLRKMSAEGGSDDLEVKYALGPDRDHFYGIFPEFGTRTQPARPFLRPAFDRQASATINRLGVELWKSIERAVKRRRR